MVHEVWCGVGCGVAGVESSGDESGGSGGKKDTQSSQTQSNQSDTQSGTQSGQIGKNNTQTQGASQNCTFIDESGVLVRPQDDIMVEGDELDACWDLVR